MAETAQSGGINITRLVGAAGKAPAGWPGSGWEEQAPTQLEKLPGRDRPPSAFPAAQSPAAAAGPGQARSGCWAALEHGSLPPFLSHRRLLSLLLSSF